MKVIAISGWKGSGKDTVAAHLIEKHNATRTAFADPLKDLAASEYGFPRSWADDPAYKESPLLNMPVDPQDKFTKMVTDFMILEFRTADGKRANEVPMSTQLQKPQLFWTPRALCILKGSTNRAVDTAFWVKRAIQEIKQKEDMIVGEGLHIITDLRYKSELGQLAEAFGDSLVTVRINRFATSPSADPSERDLDDAIFNYALDNTGALEATLVQTEALLKAERIR